MAIYQADDLRRLMKGINNVDVPMRMYYDETNNIRRLKLQDGRLNAPVDQMFGLGGIALLPAREIGGWDDLRSEMRIQRDTPELKFRIIARPSYEEALSSWKLRCFLRWLIRQEILVHYSVFDVLYWSVVDIVDSLPEMSKYGHLHRELKNELTYAVSLDNEVFMAILQRYFYPDIARESVQDFLLATLDFIQTRIPNNRNVVTGFLKKIVRKAAESGDQEIVFLHDNVPGELIGDFSLNFAHSICIFKYAEHIFDRETVVEGILGENEVRDGERQLNYKFVDSNDEIGVQASDIVVGLMARHFSYVRNRTAQELREAKDAFSDMQLENLSLLKQLIDTAEDFSPGLLHYVMPLDTHLKHSYFLNDEELPDFLWEK